MRFWFKQDCLLFKPKAHFVYGAFNLQRTGRLKRFAANYFPLHI